MRGFGKWTIWVMGVAASLVSSGGAEAHFQELIPSTNIVTANGSRSVDLGIVFTHPMEGGPVMEMGRPVRFFVVSSGTAVDLAENLVQEQKNGKACYRASYTVKKPGDYIFAIEPAPYWEPAEQKMIIHYTKTVVNGFGEEEGWDGDVGFPVEITPLVRPYGLWTGNCFRGIVKKDGCPVPFAEIEVEYKNKEGRVAIPADPYITQVIKADRNGVFSYAMPMAGWWAFAALIGGDEPLKNPAGKDVGVELGALIWVQCVNMK